MSSVNPSRNPRFFMLRRDINNYETALNPKLRLDVTDLLIHRVPSVPAVHNLQFYEGYSLDNNSSPPDHNRTFPWPNDLQ